MRYFQYLLIRQFELKFFLLIEVHFISYCKIFSNILSIRQLILLFDKGVKSK